MARGSDLSRRSLRTERRAAAILRTAAVLGLLNAAPNLYWALGGDFLLDTIGEWIIQLQADAPVLIGGALVLIFTVKTAVSLLPLLLLGRLRNSRPLRVAAITASAALILYGASGAVVNVVLLVFTDVQDPTGRIGQAAIWYPMLLIWGLVLAGGLRTLRRCDVMSA